MGSGGELRWAGGPRSRRLGRASQHPAAGRPGRAGRAGPQDVRECCSEMPGNGGSVKQGERVSAALHAWKAPLRRAAGAPLPAWKSRAEEMKLVCRRGQAGCVFVSGCAQVRVFVARGPQLVCVGGCTRVRAAREYACMSIYVCQRVRLCASVCVCVRAILPRAQRPHDPRPNRHWMRLRDMLGTRDEMVTDGHGWSRMSGHED